ncbi:MAG: ABC transporter permease [Candidatus Heimdallarchaeaceae archaeon]
MLRFIIRFFFHNRKRTYSAIMTLTLALVIFIATTLLVKGYAANISGMASIIKPSNFLLIKEDGKSLSESTVASDVLSFLEDYAETTPNLNVILPQIYSPVTVVGETGIKIETHLRFLNLTKFEMFQSHKYSYGLTIPNENELVIGQQLSTLLSSGAGATLMVKSSNIAINYTTSFQIEKNYTIVNTIESGQEYDIELLGNIETFFEKYNLNYYSFIELKILDTRESPVIIEDINKEFNNIEVIEEKQTQNFIIYATDEVIKTLTLLESLFFVLMLISITYSIYTLVKESEEEIFILRSIGSTKAQIVFLFMMQALLIGLISATLSLIIGYLMVSAIVAVVSAIQSLPFIALTVNFGLVGTIFLFAITLSLVSGIYPAMTAAKIRVIKEE